MAKKDSEIIRGFQLMAAYHHNGTFNNISYHSLSKTTDFTDDKKADWDVLQESDWRVRGASCLPISMDALRDTSLGLTHEPV